MLIEGDIDWRVVVDLTTFVGCSAMMGIYQWRLIHHTRNHPEATVQGMNAHARGAWVEHVMSGGRDVMAVQTFRNSTMAATLMASTAVLLIFGIFNILASADKITSAFHSINHLGSHEHSIRNLKLMVLLIDFFVAFFSFSLAVRGYHHLGYLINVPINNNVGITPKKVIQNMNTTSRFYSIGMRSYFFSVPIVLWLFGPVWMLVATIALLYILNHLDHLSE